MMNNMPTQTMPWKSLALIFSMAGSLYLFSVFFSIAVDTQEERCLENAKVILLEKWHQKNFYRSEYVYFKPFAPGLAYVKAHYVVKQIVGLPGDTLSIQDEVIKINGKIVGEGLPLATWYRRPKSAYAKNEVIPQGHLFVMGTNPKSNDSRYWGYIRDIDIEGRAIPLI